MNGRCAVCKRRRDVFRAQRFGGGNYRRGGRWYDTSVCRECAVEAVAYADQAKAEGRNPGTKWQSVSLSSLRRIVSSAGGAR